MFSNNESSDALGEGHCRSLSFVNTSDKIWSSACKVRNFCPLCRAVLSVYCPLKVFYTANGLGKTNLLISVVMATGIQKTSLRLAAKDRQLPQLQGVRLRVHQAWCPISQNSRNELNKKVWLFPVWSMLDLTLKTDEGKTHRPHPYQMCQWELQWAPCCMARNSVNPWNNSYTTLIFPGRRWFCFWHVLGLGDIPVGGLSLPLERAKVEDDTLSCLKRTQKVI